MIDFNLMFVAILAFLQLADVISTHVILSRGGRELNPILSWLFRHANPLWVMGILTATSSSTISRKWRPQNEAVPIHRPVAGGLRLCRME